MGDGRSANGRPIPADDDPVRRIKAAIRELAYTSWASYQADLDRDTSRALFERVYLGHYSTMDTYVIQLIDDYGLDAKLDAAIIEPFRSHVDIDVSAMARALVASATIYAAGCAGRCLGIQRRIGIGKPCLCCGMNKDDCSTNRGRI